MIDGVLQSARSGKSKPADRRQFIRRLLLNKPLRCSLTTHSAVDYLLKQVDRAEWTERFGSAVETEAPHVVVEIVGELADVDHRDLLRLLPINPAKTLFAILRELSDFLESVDGSDRYLRGMRATRILADIYSQLHENPAYWKRRSAPACCIDSKKIVQLKEQKDGAALSEAYQARTNQLQRKDLRTAWPPSDGPRTPLLSWMNGLRTVPEGERSPAHRHLQRQRLGQPFAQQRTGGQNPERQYRSTAGG